MKMIAKIIPKLLTYWDQNNQPTNQTTNKPNDYIIKNNFLARLKNIKKTTKNNGLTRPNIW